jgi:hypothetical protein
MSQPITVHEYLSGLTNFSVLWAMSGAIRKAGQHKIADEYAWSAVKSLKETESRDGVAMLGAVLTYYLGRCDQQEYVCRPKDVCRRLIVERGFQPSAVDEMPISEFAERVKSLLASGSGTPKRESKRRWQDVADELDKRRRRGERFTSFERLAVDVGCSASTLHRAVENTPDLKSWAERISCAPLRMQSIHGEILARTPQVRERDPADILEQPDIERAMDLLMQQVSTEEDRERIRRMTPDERQRCARLVESQKLDDSLGR